jgi:hypothetical protein
MHAECREIAFARLPCLATKSTLNQGRGASTSAYLEHIQYTALPQKPSKAFTKFTVGHIRGEGRRISVHLERHSGVCGTVLRVFSNFLKRKIHITIHKHRLRKA